MACDRRVAALPVLTYIKYAARRFSQRLFSAHFSSFNGIGNPEILSVDNLLRCRNFVDVPGIGLIP